MHDNMQDKHGDAENTSELQGKLRKIVALRDGASTMGERKAAEAALDRVRLKLPVRITATVLNIDRNETLYEVDYRDLDGKSARNGSLGSYSGNRPTSSIS